MNWLDYNVIVGLFSIAGGIWTFFQRKKWMEDVKKSTIEKKSSLLMKYIAKDYTTKGATRTEKELILVSAFAVILGLILIFVL